MFGVPETAIAAHDSSRARRSLRGLRGHRNPRLIIIMIIRHYKWDLLALAIFIPQTAPAPPKIFSARWANMAVLQMG